MCLCCSYAYFNTMFENSQKRHRMIKANSWKYAILILVIPYKIFIALRRIVVKKVFLLLLSILLMVVIAIGAVAANYRYDFTSIPP